MANLFKIRVLSLVVLVLFLLFLGCEEKKIDFNTQVKPILNKHCIACHGGVKKSGGFGMLFRQDALAKTESGKPAIIPGDPNHSEMIRRITSTDPEQRMPYKKNPLSAEEIDILQKWIKQGAEWGNHWAYVKPKEVKVPQFSSSEKWLKNPIDNFVLEKLNEQKLQPAPEADKSTLLRRVYFDLIGLPPTKAQADKFLADKSSQAYEKVVDELLKSPQFGEKWASWWLDMARYSDTKGYERDDNRKIWRYRDWVIKAFNQDMPFDQFTIEQLAGDLLPTPSDEQLIATAFHRNTMNNDEGGTDDEEFRVSAVIDRVNTTMTVWQSTTMACVQCHSHPYDPFRHEEYYKMMAFFNNSRDEDVDDESPNLRIYEEKDAQKLNEVRNWIKNVSNESQARNFYHFLKTLEPKHNPHDCDQFVNGELIDTKWLGIRSGGHCRFPNAQLRGKTNFIFNYWADKEGGSLEIRKNKPDGELLLKTIIPSTQGKRKVMQVPLNQLVKEEKTNLYFVFTNPSLEKERAVCGVVWFAFMEDLPGKGEKVDFNHVNQQFIDLLNAETDNTPVMIENPQNRLRVTQVFERGNWLVKGKKINPTVPASLNPFPKDKENNRLGLAHWLVSKDNPLTARTLVNRLWEQVFGRGFVNTLEDLGTQGDTPTHPELLDWLSLRLMNDYQWSMKKLLREIVLSATYRQDSKVNSTLLDKDPDNRWLSRGPRVRLTAEQIRDQALQLSGLLSNKMFGPSVMPYQPEGVWQTVYNSRSWQQSEGEDQYRRAVYTFTKRTSPYPSLMMFDGSSREVCQVKRINTNTPLQALVTLNDPVFLEAARNLALLMQKNGDKPESQIKKAYSDMLLRNISEAKLKILLNLYQQALKQYQNNQEALKKLNLGQQASPELAALMVVSNALLNLDELITKE
jgi:hypothetical protein